MPNHRHTSHSLLTQAATYPKTAEPTDQPRTAEGPDFASEQIPGTLPPPDHRDRGRATLLAHACSDRYGAALEFIADASVRDRAIELDNWTDDTHMSLYLGEAILTDGAGRLQSERLGQAIGDAFVRWSHDPLTPSTAPGHTCLSAAANLEHSRDWRSSGIKSSDGCGAVMRVAPLALAYRRPELLEAARLSALVTHAHPNALEAAIAFTWLLGQVLDSDRLDSALAEHAAKQLQGDWNQGGNVTASLRAALLWVPREEAWLDEAMIPPGDGGWRSGSALGLAVAVALRWPDNLPLGACPT